MGEASFSHPLLILRGTLGSLWPIRRNCSSLSPWEFHSTFAIQMPLS
jgi:hypothetical protein